MSKKTKTKIEEGVHYFNCDDAIKHGIEKAVLIYNLRFWLKINKANDTNIKTKDGKKYYWSFNSVSALQELMPYFNQSSMQRWYKELERDGFIITGSFNKLKYDKTKWYTLPEFEIVDSVNQIEEEVTQNDESITQNDEPIPDSNIKIENKDIIKENIITLPLNRGNQPSVRIDSIYSTLFNDKYGFNPPNALIGSRRKIFKELVGSYTELQIARLLIAFFEWRGMTGNDDKEENYVTSKTHDVFTFKFYLPKLEAKIRNIEGEGKQFEDDRLLLAIVGKYIMNINKMTLTQQS